MNQGLRDGLLALVMSGVFLVVGTGCAKKLGTSEQSVGVSGDQSTLATEEVFDERFDVQEEDLQEAGLQKRDQMDQGFSAGLEDVFFEFDQSLIRSKDQKVLDENVRWLKENPRTTITIQGHADDRGTNEYNMTLGERRAQAAKRYMIRHGIEPNRIRTISYGEENPFCSQRTEKCWQENRRGHFVKLN